VTSLHEHLERHDVTARTIAFRRDCPLCRAERVQRRLPSATLVPPRACAAVTAVILATSAAAPASVIADGQGVAVPAPPSPPAPPVADVHAGGGGAAPADGGDGARTPAAQGTRTSGSHEATADRAPAETSTAPTVTSDAGTSAASSAASTEPRRLDDTTARNTWQFAADRRGNDGRPLGGSEQSARARRGTCTGACDARTTRRRAVRKRRAAIVAVAAGGDAVRVEHPDRARARSSVRAPLLVEGLGPPRTRARPLAGDNRRPAARDTGRAVATDHPSPTIAPSRPRTPRVLTRGVESRPPSRRRRPRTGCSRATRYGGSPAGSSDQTRQTSNRAGGEPAVDAQRAANRDRQPGPDLPWPDAEDVTPAIGFTDFDPPTALDSPDTPPPSEPARAPRARRDDFFDTPIVDGKPAPNTPFSRLRDIMRSVFVSSGEREEAQLETSLRRLPGASRTNIVATLPPKCGCGKTTSTFRTGNVLASHLRLRVLAVDLNPDFGTLADLAPDRTRAPMSLVDLLRDKQDIASPGELRPYVSRLPSGLHLLAAPPHPAVMAQMTPELYGSGSPSPRNWRRWTPRRPSPRP
jgi:hypothetical protein